MPAFSPAPREPEPPDEPEPSPGDPGLELLELLEPGLPVSRGIVDVLLEDVLVELCARVVVAAVLTGFSALNAEQTEAIAPCAVIKSWA